MNSAIDPEMLRRFFCFADLTSEEARQVAGLLSTIDLENGEMLFQQGVPSSALYLLIFRGSANPDRPFGWIAPQSRDAGAGRDNR